MALENTVNNGTEATAQTARPTASGYSGLSEESGAFHSFLEHTATYSFFLLFAAALYFSLTRLAGHNRLWLILFAVPLGMMAGDFVSGIAHWLADTYGSERTPLVGEGFIKWFRLHHVYPKDICTHKLHQHEREHLHPRRAARRALRAARLGRRGFRHARLFRADHGVDDGDDRRDQSISQVGA